jgi:hypothetical protein
MTNFSDLRRVLLLAHREALRFHNGKGSGEDILRVLKKRPKLHHQFDDEPNHILQLARAINELCEIITVYCKQPDPGPEPDWNDNPAWGRRQAARYNYDRAWDGSHYILEQALGLCDLGIMLTEAEL